MLTTANFAGRRAVRGVYILFGVSLGSFILSELAPGDFYAEARLNPQISRDTLVAMKLQHHLDQPLILKYCYWLESVVHGEWGYSLSYNMPVGALLWSRLVNTLVLTVTATILAWLVAIPAGIWLATGGRALNRLLARGGLAEYSMAGTRSGRGRPPTEVLPDRSASSGTKALRRRPRLGAWSPVCGARSHRKSRLA